MSKPKTEKSDQERFTSGRWQAGRIEIPGRADPADGWVVDVVVVEEEEGEDLRAIRRYRPARDMTPDLGPVIESSIRRPVDGRPHLPAVVRVANEALAAEIAAKRPEVKVVIGPTPLVEELGREWADKVVPDDDSERWTWVGNGVGVDKVKRLFAAAARVAEALAGGVVMRYAIYEVTCAEPKLKPGWVHVIVDDAITGGLVSSIAIAPDRESRAAWDDDASSAREIGVYLLERDDLPKEAYAEVKENGWAGTREVYPRVVAGGDAERVASANEVEIAIAALEALAGAADPFAADPTPGAARTIELSRGGKATIALSDEQLEGDEDDDEDEDDEDDDEIDDDGFDDLDREFLKLDSERTWAGAGAATQATVRNAPNKPGRNDPCWCGSGQKYKKCHLDKDR